MTFQRKNSVPSPDSAPYEEALKETIRKRESNGEDLHSTRSRVLELEQRDTELARLARSLLQEIPEPRRGYILNIYPWLSNGPDPASRNLVMVGIQNLFVAHPERQWTPPDIQAALERQGIHADAKRVLNSLNYLSSDQRIIRISRGLYAATDYTPVFSSNKEEVSG